MSPPDSASPKPAKAPTSADSQRANPTADSLQTIHGYPDRLKIYRIPASSYWWVRATFGERRIKRSTKETDKAKAIRFAKQFYEDLLRNDLAVPLKTSNSFSRAALSLQEEHRQKAATGERNSRFEADLRKQLKRRILPFFKQYSLKDVNYEVLSKFVATMRRDNCSPSTINRHLVSIRQVLKHAVKMDLLGALPIFPSVKAKDNPRPWFSESEYNTLKDKAEEAIAQGYSYKGEPLTEEVRDFVIFMVNTFLRPSDWYELKRKHVTVQQRKGDEPLLIISTSRSKTLNTPVVSMPAAVGVYKKIIERQDKRQQAQGAERLTDEAYVFLPHIKGRPYAQALMRNFFEHLLKFSGLKHSLAGGQRTIYSLRHTAIALRLLKGENVDLLFLARNCRTSVDMIDRFYCRHLNALMSPEKIVGLKAKTRRQTSKPVDLKSTKQGTHDE